MSEAGKCHHERINVEHGKEAQEYWAVVGRGGVEIQIYMVFSHGEDVSEGHQEDMAIG